MRVWRRDVLGWVLYDFANVLFSLMVITVYFPLWIVDEAGGRDANYAFVSSVSMAIVFLVSPFLGVLSDRVPKRIPMLVVLTFTSCLAALFMGGGGLTWALILFVIANCFFQFSLLIYDSLLPSVSTEQTTGRVSGWGFAAGFAGSLAGILIGLAVLSRNGSAHPTIFKIGAALFLIFSIPCFLWVKERRVKAKAPQDRSIVRGTIREVRRSFKDSRQLVGFNRFLVGRFFYSDAINTVMIFMSIYATEEIGLSELQTQLVLLAGIIIGPLGALWSGSAVDRDGPKRTLNVMLLVWAVALFATAMIPLLDLPSALFWIVAPLIGIGLGGTSTTERAYLLRLVPPHQVGRFLGLYAMVGRFAAIVSPLIWILVADWLGLGRPGAVLTLLGMLVVSRRILSRVDDSRRIWDQPVNVTGSTQI
jgi:UMF1 family MFS transporter